VEFILPTENPSNVESSKELDNFCVGFDSWGVFVPIFPTFFCFIGKNGSRASEPCPPVVEPDGKSICAIVIEIKEP